MPRIDGFIREMFEREAERLAIGADRPVTLTLAGKEEPISTYTPNEAQVERVLQEILPGDAPAPGDGERHRFTYRSPSGPVEVRARMEAGASLLLVFPEGAEAGGAGVADTNGSGAGHAGPGPAERAGEAAGEAAWEDDAAAQDAGAQEARSGAPGNGAGPPPGSPEAAAAAALAAVPEDPDTPAIDRLFRKMVANGCSDLHVSAGSPPLFRKDGEMVDLGDEPALSPDETGRMLLEIAPERARHQFEERRDADFAYEIAGVARFRCNLFEDRRGVGGVFRQIPSEILTAEQLGLPPGILEFCELKKGLVLVTGPTGSGKSTTLAAMVDHINGSRREHIITIEDPIEFVHGNRRCLVNQREVGEHTRSFKAALRAALREDPDIVLVGEMRDLETVEIALETAETGHLVLGTLHTNTAASTVSRVIDQFPSGQQAQIRTMLAESLKGVIAQTLCRRTGGGRVAAMEVLVVTPAVSNLIREDKTYQIPSVMQTGKAAGMRTMNDALLALVREGAVEASEAYRNAVEKAEFKGLLERNGIAL